MKEKYRSETGSSRITLGAEASQENTLISCSVDIGRAIHQAEAHAGVGGTGAACSGDLLLGALAACAQVTCQLGRGGHGNRDRARPGQGRRGDGPRRYTWYIQRGAGRVRKHQDYLRGRSTGSYRGRTGESAAKTEQYCVVFQTLVRPPRLETEWA